MSENNFLWWPKIFQQLLSKISSSKSTNSSQQSPFSVNPVEMWRRTKRTVAHRWFWEAITTKASLSPYFRSVPALLVMLEFQGWSRDGSPSPWLATSLWSSLFTLSLLSLSLHCCFSSLRRLYVHIRIPTHNCVCCNICFDDIFVIFSDIFTCWTSPKMFVFESQICYFFTDRLKRVTSSRVFASFSLFLETCGASNFSWPPLCVRDCCFSSWEITFTNLKACLPLCDRLAAVAAPIVT